MLISYLVTFLRHICQSTDKLLGLMPGMMHTWTTLSLHLLLPPSLLLQLEYMLLFHLIMQTILGSLFLGMGSTIHLFPCLVVLYTVDCGGGITVDT
jgi:hypothetical protein